MVTGDHYKKTCHFERSEKSAFVVHSKKADFSPEEDGFEMTVSLNGVN